MSLKSKFNQFRNWWTKNIIHHGEPDNISDLTGMSEEDMSKQLSDSEYQNYKDSLSGPISEITDRSDVSSWLKDKNSKPLQKNLAKGMLSVLATYFGINLLRNHNNYYSADDSNFEADSDALRMLSSVGVSLGDKQPFSGVKDFFKSFSNSQFAPFLTGLSSQLGTSWLNMRNMEQLIDKQNAYNTPSQQMQRFADAGLNPNLIYGLGSNGNQPASGSIAPVDFDTAQRENRMAKFQMSLQARQAEADIAQKQSMTNLYNKQAQGADIENQFNAQTLNERIATVSANLSKLTNDLEIQTKEINNWDEYRQAQLDLMQAQMYASYLSGHSIFGKVTLELDEISERLKTRYPRFYEEWQKFQEGMSSGVGHYINN